MPYRESALAKASAPVPWWHRPKRLAQRVAVNRRVRSFFEFLFLMLIDMEGRLDRDHFMKMRVARRQMIQIRSGYYWPPPRSQD